MIKEETYEVKTYWGWFRLDRGAYEDYLAGKLWITWVPASVKKPAVETQSLPALPPDLSQEAIQMRERAARQGVYSFLREMCPGESVPIPYKNRMKDYPIDEMALSVRASNGLMRAGTSSFGKLFTLMQDKGLRSVRNLGIKSEREIVKNYFIACYSKLTPAEQAYYWQDFISSRG